MFEELQSLVHWVVAANPKITPEEPVDPGALVSPVGDEADPDLHYREGKGVVGDAVTVAGLHGSVEKVAAMGSFDLFSGGLINAGVRGSTLPVAQLGENDLADAEASVILLPNGFLDLGLQALVKLGQFVAAVPCIQVQRAR
ncbi:MAG: hypothetical protein HY683_01465 [Chloroflexi bacterium]|nr:hypothetical protein [Chloroflexota bacterium]